MMGGYDLQQMLAAGAPLRFGERSATGCDRFDYAPGQPNLFMLMLFKQLLVAEHGVENGFDLYRQTVSKQKNATLDIRRLASLHTFCAANSKSYFEIFPAGEPMIVMPPRVIGDGNHRPLEGTTRCFFVANLGDALVRGRSSIVEVNGAALADYQGVELESIDDEIEFDSAVFHRDKEHIWTIAQDRQALQFDTAFSLLGCRTDFFGDWLCEFITKYVAATLHDALPAVPVLIDECMPRTHRQALELMLPSPIEIVEVPAFEPVRVKRLWMASSIAYMPFHQKFNERFTWDNLLSSSQRCVSVGREMGHRADRALGHRTSPAKVFLARKEFRHRKLVNCAAIEAIASSRGFAIVYPEELDFLEQVRLLRNARFVVAPEGSALFLTYFVKRGTKICILNHQNTAGLVMYNDGCDLTEVEITIITGPEAKENRRSPQDADYQIDERVFCSFLEDWLGVA
jgi:capsular polysaccharide biosynthesis protein